jgi:glycosyltransferase involved in cell wall biosynthesis
MQSNLVSIAIATYNGEKYLCEQLDSIKNQTYSDLEIIICDDGSTDTTWSILQNYAHADSRIKIFRNERNLGLVKNFEKAISLCTGDFIALSDQDDIWLPEKIKTLLYTIKSCDLIHSDASLIDENNTVFEKSFSSYSNKNHSNDFLGYLFGNNVTGCTALFRRSLLEGHLPFPEEVHVHDWWIAILAAKNNGVTYLHQPLIHYRQHNNNQIGATSAFHIPSYEIREKNLLAHIQLLRMILNYFSFDSSTANFIHSLIRYHEDFFSKNIRFHSFVFHLVHFNRMHGNKPTFYRLASLFLSFFGHKIQKIIWPSNFFFHKSRK